jgi:hypothetical protein
MDTKNLVKKVTAKDREIKYLLGGGVAKFRLEDSVELRKPWFDKRIKKDRKRSKLAKQSRKRNR